MSKKHLSKKEIESDIVHEMGENIIEKWDLYKQKVLYGIAALAIIVILVRVNSCMSVQREVNAGAAINLLQTGYDEAATAAGGDDAEQAKTTLDKLLADCDKVANEYGSEPIGIEALYVKGNALLIAPDLDKALTVFGTLLEMATEPADQAKAQIAIAAIYADKFFLAPDDKDMMAKSQAAYDAALKLGTDEKGGINMYARQAMMGIGKLCEQAKDYEGAKKAYQNLVDKAPDFENGNEDLDEEGISSDEQNVRAYRNALRSSPRTGAFKKQAEGRLEFIKGILAEQK